MTQPLPILKPGDQVEIVAPASRCSEEQLQSLVQLLESWQLHCIYHPHIFGNDLLCANSDKLRFDHLQSALQNLDNKAIICVRGGYGSIKLIPQLAHLNPLPPKLFVGMSDITTLHLFFQQMWQWPVLHGALSTDRFSKSSLEQVRKILFAELEQVEFVGEAWNSAARDLRVCASTMTGGNLSLVQTSLATNYQIQTDDRIVFLEEVSERGYRIDRMLAHLSQAGVFSKANAIVFGDFTEGDEPNGDNLIEPVLRRFAESLSIPVVKISGVGHGFENFPLPLGTPAHLHYDDKVEKMRLIVQC